MQHTNPPLLQPVPRAHILAHRILKIEGNIWYEVGLCPHQFCLSLTPPPPYRAYNARHNSIKRRHGAPSYLSNSVNSSRLTNPLRLLSSAKKASLMLHHFCSMMRFKFLRTAEAITQTAGSRWREGREGTPPTGTIKQQRCDSRCLPTHHHRSGAHLTRSPTARGSGTNRASHQTNASMEHVQVRVRACSHLNA